MKPSENHEADALIKALLALETEEECINFLEDLCTYKEINSMAQRFQVARLLKAKKTFQEIVETTGASTATISRVNRCLLYGNGGYEKIIQKL